jgi:uncharacterized membrane protein YgaE (UPF0421/DUF939 family)
MLFKNDQVVIANLQRGLHALHQTAQTFDMENVTSKNQNHGLKGTEPIRSKIVTDNMILEHLNTFTHLVSNTSYQEEKDIHSKITNILQRVRLLNNTLKPNLVQRNTRLNLYKTLALPSSFIW